MSTIILGGGIIGLSTAYYLCLAQPPSSTSSIHVVDSSSQLFTSASGYAGGFLALDWFSPSVASLGALSFRLHRELADQHGGRRKWGYAGSHVYNLSEGEVEEGDAIGKEAPEGDWIAEGTSRAQVAPSTSTATEMGDSDPVPTRDDTPPAVWTRRGGWTLETIGRPADCAQVEPWELCEFLRQECEKRGVQIHLSTTATGVLTDDKGALKGLKLRSTEAGQPQEIEAELECKNVVISAGAWTPRVFSALFPQSKLRIPIEPLAGHSIVVKSPRYTTPYVDLSRRQTRADNDSWMCYAIYCAPGPRWSYAPEAFARLARNGETEVWVGGLNDNALPLPELSTDAKGMISPESIQDLRRTAVQLTGRVSSEGGSQDDLETIREGLCFRPISQRGTPLIGALDGKDVGLPAGDSGVYIASGHGPWGISLSLGTGKVMSEMLMGQKPSANVRGLRVGR
ncbi:hypothetical protein PV04_05982 [Phialophora macrospora]|uniref:FAD dependent oxidoreductase domain-containing protein n=1 Tax=Phialophora macrospora TaxID=1851006 RepID=A0A0D2FF59_9EURO|nr:hypothetical protein PV04_05982 [Phialophora macrospora]